MICLLARIIEEHGYKVMHIWITDFKRFTLDLEDSERTSLTPGKTTPNLFDYMNVKKGKEENITHAHLLYKGSRKKLYNHFHDWQAVLDCI